MTLKNLTIVINTRNKPKLLSASLHYHASLNLSANLIVVDASDKDIFEFNEKNIAFFASKLSIGHIKPDDIRQFPSIIYGLSKVSTNYTIVCGDDDFFVPKTLQKCINFLENNSDYSACMGEVLKISGEWNPLIKKWKILNAHYLSPSSQEENKPSARLVAYANKLIVSSYAIHKTEVIRDAYEIAMNKSFERDNSLPELTLNCFMLINGKFKRIKGLYHIWFSPARKRSNIGSTLVSGYGGLHWFDKLFSEEYNAYVKSFVNVMSNELSKNQGLEANLSRDIILSVWTGLYANMLLRRLKDQLFLYNKKSFRVLSNIQFFQKMLSFLFDKEKFLGLVVTLKYLFTSKLIQNRILIYGINRNYLKLFLSSIDSEMDKNYVLKSHIGEY